MLRCESGLGCRETNSRRRVQRWSASPREQHSRSNLRSPMTATTRFLCGKNSFSTLQGIHTIPLEQQHSELAVVDLVPEPCKGLDELCALVRRRRRAEDRRLAVEEGTDPRLDDALDVGDRNGLLRERDLGKCGRGVARGAGASAPGYARARVLHSWRADRARPCRRRTHRRPHSASPATRRG